MVKFIRTIEERIAEEIKDAEEKVKEKERFALAYVVREFDDAIASIERALVNKGLALDEDAEAALAVLKHKLSDLKDKI